MQQDVIPLAGLNVRFMRLFNNVFRQVVQKIAQVSGLSRKGVQKDISENGNPQLGSINAIMHAMGYRLAAQKLSASFN